MRNSRTQLLGSHIALITLMVVMMAGAVSSFMHLGRSIGRILRNNYKTVAAMHEIRDTLAREDEAALLAVAGRRQEARNLHAANATRFDASYDVQVHNITESGERELTNELGRRYSEYRQELDRFLAAAPKRTYESALRRANESVIVQTELILRLNEQAMNRADVRARSESQQASYTGVALTIGASLIAFLFALRAAAARREEELRLQRAEIAHLKDVDRLKTEFIGVASHELRTPVTSLLLSTQLLNEGAAGALTEPQLQIVNTQLGDLKRLDGVMHDLLDLSRLESGAVPPRLVPVSPDEIARAAIRSIEAQAADRQVTIENEIGQVPKVQADKSMITRVLVNLLDNAIRHSPAESQVQIRAHPNGKTVTIEVQDHGEGIAPEQLGRIFDSFAQAPGATSGGAGLGLSIAQQIVRAHGGEIRATSEEGRGSVFAFTLPVVVKR